MSKYSFKSIFSNYLIIIIQNIRIYFYKFISVNISGNPKLIQPVYFNGKGKIICSPNVTFGYRNSIQLLSNYGYIEARNEESEIILGEGTHFNNSILIISEKSSITIGKNCLFGTNVEIIDSDFHSINLIDRLNNIHEAKPVKIGDNVFIGSNVKILKGVTIGNEAVVANGAIVINDVLEKTIVGGNPAKIIRKIN